MIMNFRKTIMKKIRSICISLIDLERQHQPRVVGVKTKMARGHKSRLYLLIFLSRVLTLKKPTMMLRKCSFTSWTSEKCSWREALNALQKPSKAKKLPGLRRRLGKCIGQRLIKCEKKEINIMRFMLTFFPAETPFCADGTEQKEKQGKKSIQSRK